MGETQSAEDTPTSDDPTPLEGIPLTLAYARLVKGTGLRQIASLHPTGVARGVTLESSARSDDGA